MANKQSEESVWNWYIGAPLLAILALHLPWIIVVVEGRLFGTRRIYYWFDSVGIVKLLNPIYQQTVERIF